MMKHWDNRGDQTGSVCEWEILSVQVTASTEGDRGTAVICGLHLYFIQVGKKGAAITINATHEIFGI
jgi:hypothetical protein